MPNSRTTSAEAKPVTVIEQNVLEPPASDNNEAKSKVGEKANMKDAASVESKKSAKPEKKQGTSG